MALRATVKTARSSRSTCKRVFSCSAPFSALSFRLSVTQLARDFFDVRGDFTQPSCLGRNRHYAYISPSQCDSDRFFSRELFLHTDACCGAPTRSGVQRLSASTSQTQC
jgi:hypothetical protein